MYHHGSTVDDISNDQVDDYVTILASRPLRNRTRAQTLTGIVRFATCNLQLILDGRQQGNRLLATSNQDRTPIKMLFFQQLRCEKEHSMNRFIH